MTRESGHRPLIIAHRGDSGNAPENTRAAFHQAIEKGAHVIECDVRLTKDHQLAVIHDATLRRTTNGEGYVRDHSLEELRSLDAGGWFHRSYAGERIPLLQEVLELTRGRVGLNIEIKPVLNRALAEVIVRGCLEVVQRYRAHNWVLLTSFQHSLLHVIRRRDASALVGLLYHPFHHAGVSPIRLAQRLEARVAVCAVRFLSKTLVEKAHRSHVAVAAYTVNNDRYLHRCLTLGIEGVVTNVPGEIIRILRERDQKKVD
jgi:glycerophosphoryl diester phosphodiesterase